MQLEGGISKDVCCCFHPLLWPLLLGLLQVLARSSPEDKLTLVSLLKKEGEVVAVTGDPGRTEMVCWYDCATT